jgi:hypothetical protein
LIGNEFLRATEPSYLLYVQYSTEYKSELEKVHVVPAAKDGKDGKNGTSGRDKMGRKGPKMVMMEH